MRTPTASLLFFLLVLVLSALGQSAPPGAPIPAGYGAPPPTIYTPPYSKRSPPPQIDTTAVRREAKELLELSQSVQPDVEALNRGLLSKDLTDKLKRIEKLSKHLRSEITP